MPGWKPNMSYCSVLIAVMLGASDVAVSRERFIFKKIIRTYIRKHSRMRNVVVVALIM